MIQGNSICPATNICFLLLHTITNSATSPYRGPRVKKTLEISWTAPYNRATRTNQVMWCPQPENFYAPRWLRRWYTNRKPPQQLCLEVFAQLQCYTQLIGSSYRCFRTTSWSHLQGTVWKLQASRNVGTNYQSTLREIRRNKELIIPLLYFEIMQLFWSLVASLKLPDYCCFCAQT